jgi:F-type H+-transporting ATPase subunit delta
VKQAVVARNYADALLAVAAKEGAVERCGALLDAVAGAVAASPRAQAVLMSPRVPKAVKLGVLERSLAGVAPAPFLRFLAAVVHRGRQGLLREIAEAYEDAADIHFNRVHASVTTARPVDEALGHAITERLTAVVGKTVMAHFESDPAILGGIVVRVGDQVLDGSVRRRIARLRGRMLRAPGGGAAA